MQTISQKAEAIDGHLSENADGCDGGRMMPQLRKRIRLEDGLKLNLNQLIKQGAVVPGRKVRALVAWPQSYSGRPAASCVLTSDLSSLVRGWMHLNRGVVEQSFWLVTEPRHFGGRQWYFRCPRTDRRVSVLWKPPGADCFLSRQACEPQVAYGSQFQTWHDRACSAARAVRHRLGGSDYVDFNGEPPPKPKGMHWRTYEREIARIKALENACNLYLTEAISHFATDFDWWRACT
jgi:hypothetical protein